MTAKIIDVSGLPQIEGKYTFEFDKNVKFNEEIQTTTKGVNFEWCVEIPQNPNRPHDLYESLCFELLAEKLKTDFLEFLKSPK